MAWPETLSINAWTSGDSTCASPLAGPTSRRWAMGRVAVPNGQNIALGPEAQRSQWWHPDIGWGIMLPANEGLDDAALGRVEDAPEPLQALYRSRSYEIAGVRHPAPLFRWHADASDRHARLYRHYPDGRSERLLIAGSVRGVGPGAMPEYLLIAGSPAVIPWSVQFLLHGAAMVGRLDLDEPNLARYVDALMGEWAGASARADAALVWSVVHGPTDITQMMRDAIAAPIVEKLRTGPELGSNVSFVDGVRDNAMAGRLLDELASRQPGLVVTTSHGKTSPLAQPELMAAQLGLLVDSDLATVSIETLLDGWSPGGAIWYAHACCSAGCEGVNRFDGLVEPGGKVDRVLRVLASLGDSVAPLPRALLGAKSPLRAFLGHVQPTFDWTLCEPQTRQMLTTDIQRALADRLYRHEPLGLAFDRYHRDAVVLAHMHQTALEDFNDGTGDLDLALALRLTARDRQSMVILGDPTVVLTQQ